MHPASLKRLALCAVLILPWLAGCEPGAQAPLSELSEPERSLFQQAFAKREEGKIEEALELYFQAARLSRGSVEAHVAAAETLRSEDKAAKALPMLQEALNLKPHDPRLHMEIGFSYIARSEYDQAIASFDKALALDEELSSAYSGKAVAFDLQGKHQDAQKIYAEAIARGLSSPSLDSNYALSLVFTGQYEEAIRLLEPHANASTATPVMRQNLALAYGLKGDVGRAKEYGERDLDPIKARQNLEFYKRFTALKNEVSSVPVQIKNAEPAAGPQAGKAIAAPVSPVLQQDVGFTTGEQGSENVTKPEVEVIEVDPEEFKALQN